MNDDTQALWGVAGLLAAALLIALLARPTPPGGVPSFAPTRAAAPTQPAPELPPPPLLAPPHAGRALPVPPAIPAPRPVVTLLQLGNDILAPDRRLHRDILPHAVYDTYTDGRGIWRFMEGGGHVSLTPAPPLTDAPFLAAMANPDAKALPTFAWPSVDAMERIDPAAALQDTLPVANSGFDKTLGTIHLGINRALQAEDGTVFLVISESLVGMPPSTPLPPLSLRAADKTSSPGLVGQIDVPGRRLLLAIVVAAKPIAGDHHFMLDLVLGEGPDAQTTRVDMHAQPEELHLRDAADGFFGLLSLLDGVTPVAVTTWTLSPDAAALTPTHQHLATFTRDQFAGTLFAQIADRRTLLSR